MAKKNKQLKKTNASGSSQGFYLTAVVGVVAFVALIIMIINIRGAAMASSESSATGFAAADQDLCAIKAREQGVLREQKLWNPRKAQWEKRSNFKSSEVLNFLASCRASQYKKKAQLNLDHTGSFVIN